MKINFVEAHSPSATGALVHLCAGAALPNGLDAVLAAGAAAARFKGKPGQIFEGFVAGENGAERIVLLGIGAEKGDDRARAVEKAGAALTAKYLASGVTALTVDFAGAGLSADEAAGLLLAARLRAFRHDVYRTTMKPDAKPTLKAIAALAAPEGTDAVWKAAAAVAEGVEFTRELVTEPANIIYPESFVARAEARVAGTGVQVSVLTPKEMAKLGMGALLGVAQGSARPARLLVLAWNGGKKGEAPVALVGKGVTFDTGGISLKPPGGMEDMKWDMGGAGAVAGTMLALAKRKAAANVIGVCALVENMPDGNAQRPGDVVTSMSGQTIEVINTDAEGRLVLCDALTWVQREHKPRAIVDLATLTGAIIATLAHEHAGLFANDDGLAAALAAAGKATGDTLWRLPMGDAYDKQLDSAIADMKNIGGKFGGSITAAQFLARFIEKPKGAKAKPTPWAHLDIAGTVWADKPGATWDKGATGFGVRLLDRFIRDTAEG